MTVRSHLVLALSAGLLAGGCRSLWSPVLVTASPRLVGHVLEPDSTPLRGISVAVSTTSPHSECRHASSVVTTDSAGAFELPGTTKRVRPLLARAGSLRSFQACVGSGGHAALRGYVPNAHPRTPTWVLRCVAGGIEGREPAVGTTCDAVDVREEVGLQR